jgi:hypothetical protein
LAYLRSPHQEIVRETERECRLRKIGKTIAIRGLRYETFWRRKAEVFHTTDDFEPHIDVFRFPPLGRSWFLKRWLTPADDLYVYMTGGMSDAAAPRAGPSKEPVPRTELTAYSNKIYWSETGNVDRITWWLYFLASAPFRFPEEEFSFNVGHTFSVGGPLLPGSEMTGFLFSVPPCGEMRRLCSCTRHAQVVLHVVPISDGERQLTMEDPLRLIDRFEERGVQPVFDLERRSCV